MACEVRAYYKKFDDRVEVQCFIGPRAPSMCMPTGVLSFTPTTWRKINEELVGVQWINDTQLTIDLRD